MSEVDSTQSKVSESTDSSARDKLEEIYRILLDSYGPQHWWPGDTPFEVIVGAILTQSAAWGNVEKAISRLKQAGALDPEAMHRLKLEELAELVRPSGYYNAKALKLKSFVEHLADVYGGSLERMFALDTGPMRRDLLHIHGIGEETADSIILYAAGKAAFVVDAYTRRILSRLGFSPPRDDYSSYQALFMDSLPHDERMFNEYHALLVRHGKDVCKKTPLCDRCCLKELCPRSPAAGRTPNA